MNIEMKEEMDSFLGERGEIGFWIVVMYAKGVIKREKWDIPGKNLYLTLTVKET